MKRFLASLITVLLTLPSATAQPPAAPSPPVSITLGARHGHVTPFRSGFTHTGAGNIDVAQPAPDTVIITMTGVAVAGGHPCKSSVATLDFDLEQCFEVSFVDAKLKKAKLSLEARVIGLCGVSARGSARQPKGPVVRRSSPKTRSSLPSVHRRIRSVAA